jgi:hypothetical protein
MKKSNAAHDPLQSRHICRKTATQLLYERRAMERLLTIKNFVAEVPELAMHMEIGFVERLEAKEVIDLDC